MAKYTHNRLHIDKSSSSCGAIQSRDSFEADVTFFVDPLSSSDSIAIDKQFMTCKFIANRIYQYLRVSEILLWNKRLLFHLKALITLRLPGGSTPTLPLGMMWVREMLW